MILCSDRYLSWICSCKKKKILPNEKADWLFEEVPAFHAPNDGIWLLENVPVLVELIKLAVGVDEAAWLLDDTPNLGEVEKLTVLACDNDLESNATPLLQELAGAVLALCERAGVLADNPKLHEGAEFVVELGAEAWVLEAPEFNEGMGTAFALGIPNLNVPETDFISFLFVCGELFFSVLWIPKLDILPSLPAFAFSQLTTSVNFPCLRQSNRYCC